METSFVEWLNRLVHVHPLLASVVVEFSTWGVPLFGILAVGLWLLSPPGNTVWKRACAAGLSAAAVGLLTNQVLSHIWDRARPYEAHASIVPLLPRSTDPSFSKRSRHSSALHRFWRVLRLPKGGMGVPGTFAVVVAASRVMAGMHYPSDILGSLIVSLAAGFFTARIAMERVLVPLIGLVGRGHGSRARQGRLSQPC